MQIHEIHQLSRWYQEQIQGRKIDTLLQRLVTRVKSSNSGFSHAEHKSDKEALFSALGSIDCTKLTANQRACLRHLKVDSIVLEGSEREIDSLINIGVNDTSYAISRLDGHLKSLQAATQQLSKLNSALPAIVPREYIAPLKVPEGKVLTRLTFKDEAAINNLVDFNEWAKRWYMIARGFSMAIDRPVEDFEVVNADRGSLLVDLLVGAGAMKLLCESLKALTDLAISLTELKTKLGKVKDCKELFPEQEYEALMDNAQKRLEEKEAEIVERVVERLQKQGLITKEDAMNDLSKAIKEVHRFNSAGGSMTCLSSNDDEFNEDKVQQLNSSYELLQESAEIKLLKDKEADSDH